MIWLQSTCGGCDDHCCRRWVRACDVADESAADAADPAAADNTTTTSSGATSIFEKISSGAQGLSYTAGGLVEASDTNDAAGLDATQSFSQSSGARFWSLACVVVMRGVRVVQRGLMYRVLCLMIVNRLLEAVMRVMQTNFSPKSTPISSAAVHPGLSTSAAASDRVPDPRSTHVPLGVKLVHFAPFRPSHPASPTPWPIAPLSSEHESSHSVSVSSPPLAEAYSQLIRVVSNVPGHHSRVLL